MAPDYIHSWYTATAQPLQPFPAMDGDARADVVVVGGGIAGLSAALHLRERGYDVLLLEAERVGWGASGRSGGQVIFGYACDIEKIEAQVGEDDAKKLFEVTVDALDLTRALIHRHEIDCGFRPGQIHAAIKPRQHRDLVDWQADLEQRFGYGGMELLTGDDVRRHVNSPRYVAGLLDPNSFHLHPLNYTLGLARAASDAGVRIHEGSRALGFESSGGTVRVSTDRGTVTADFAVLAGNTGLGDVAPQIRSRIMPVGTYIAATRPLSDAEAKDLLPTDVSVSDINFVLDYFRLGTEGDGTRRLLFGGRVSYSTLKPPYLPRVMKKRVAQVFPQLGDVRFDYVWGGYVDITMSRAPDFGRLADNVLYLQGFSGHGMGLAGMAGKLAADAVAGQAERFDLFSKIRHRPFPGGRALRTPALAAAMLWYRMRDLR